MKKYLGLIVFLMFGLVACTDNDTTPETDNCTSDNSMDEISSRSFNMGFTSWPYGPNETDKTSTYSFISENADIYGEQLDDKIPWDALINNKELPSEFLNDIEFRLQNKIANHKLVLSVSLLNSDRDDLIEDYDGSKPTYIAINDKHIEDAYFKHLEYLMNAFSPDYLVFAIEVNDLKIKSEQKWSEYKLLAANIRSRLKTAYPDLSCSESITLHNFFEADTPDQESFITEIGDYVNTNCDFAAISFYPFFKGLYTKSDFQRAFDFLHSKITIPLAFSETAHIAENLEIESYNLNIPSDACEQKDYLEVLLLNAHKHNYKFILWWAHRDFDQLWAVFPDEYKDLAKIWRDTGLLDENGEQRPAFSVWETILSR